MSGEKVCYFTIISSADGDRNAHVRFGFVPRANSQIEANYGRWQDIAKRLRDEGYELIEHPGR